MSSARTTFLVAVLALAFGCGPSPSAKAPEPGKSTSDSPKTGENPTSDSASKTPGKEGETPKPDPNLGKVSGGEGQAYTLRLNVPQGWKKVYSFTVDTFMDPRNMKADDPMRKTAPEYSTMKLVGEMDVKVDKAGGGQWSLINSPKVISCVGTGAWKSQADEMKTKPQEASKYTWDDHLRNVNIAKEDFVDPLTNTLNGLFPNDPVKVGSHWTYRPFPKALVDSKVVVEKLETVSGVEALKMRIDTPSANEGDKSTFLVWIDPKTGMYVRTELHIEGNQNGLISKNDFIQTLKQ